MMKKILALFFCAWPILMAEAQSYGQLWRKAAGAADKDLPQSAWQVVKQIRRKAVAEGNDAQLLRAVLMERVYGGEISPDSAEALTERMEAALQGETRPVVRQLWCSALAQVCGPENGRHSGGGIAYWNRVAKSRKYFEASLSDLAALADARAADYLPLFREGAYSKYFHQDLLHILLHTYRESPWTEAEGRQALLRRAIALYEGRGDREATLLLTLDTLRTARQGHLVAGALEGNAFYKAYSALAEKYGDTPVAVRIYEEMADMADSYNDDNPSHGHNDSLLVATARRAAALYGEKADKGETNALLNFISRMEAPRADLSGLADGYVPGTQAALQLRTRHLRQVQLRVTRLCGSRRVADIASQEQERKMLTGNLNAARTAIFPVPEAEAWAWQEQTEMFSVPDKPGVYLAELSFDGKVYDSKKFSVSSLHPLVFHIQGLPSRVVVVDALSGKPVPGAKITAYSGQSPQQTRVWVVDAAGTAQVTPPAPYQGYTFYVSTASDAASLSFDLNSDGYFSVESGSGERAETTLDLFSDRAVYRPGQQVQFSGVAYTCRGDDFKAEPGMEAKITLYNVNYKVVDTLRVKTDEFGSFHGAFTLPAAALPGRFSMVAKSGGLREWLYFKVEEYKRPTFTASTEPVRSACVLGDTVQVAGAAKTYSGVPVAGATVKYTVNRGRWYRGGGDEEVQAGEAVTDSAGKFRLPVFLYASEKERQPQLDNSFYYHVNYTVTAENGETVEGAASLSAAAWKARLSCAVPASVCKERPVQFTVRQVNAAHEDMDAAGTYAIVSARPSHEEAVQGGGWQGDTLLTGTFRAGVPFEIEKLKALPSGNYRFVARTPDCPSPMRGESGGGASPFVLFSEADTKPADRENVFFAYSRESAAQDSCFIMVGTREKDALLFCDLVAGGKVVESRRVTLSDSLVNVRLSYKPEYGDGAKAYFAMVKAGELYTYEAGVQRPAPDKRLQLRWSSFRSRLVPGQAEEWRLRVSRPDGTPASALVMARMYDASLDAFAKDKWAFSGIRFDRRLPFARWYMTDYSNPWDGTLFGEKEYKSLVPPARLLMAWRPELFEYTIFYQSAGVMKRRAHVRKREAYVVQAMVESKTMAAEDAVAMPVMLARNTDIGADGAVLEESAVSAGAASPSAGTGQGAALRKDFSETAFFRPALRTDAAGEVSIAFTLPGSMTQWNFTALAHDAAMNYGRIDTALVARKDFMVEPALPRFLRSGDEAVLPVKVTNLSGAAVKADLTLTLEDALHEGVYIYKESQPVSLAAGESRVFRFPYKVQAEAAVLVCRATAQGGGYSDGEEHYLPVLSDLVEVTRTLPFSMTEKGGYAFRIDTLFHAARATNRALTVEYSSNPLWYAVTALPVLAGDARCLSATEWATRYYALALGQSVAEKNPAIRSFAAAAPQEVSALAKLQIAGLTDETPWLRHAESGQERTEALKNLFDADLSAASRATALAKLKDLQRPDGSWSWYPGMLGNAYITVDVAIALARVQKLAAERGADNLLRPAYDFLKEEMARQVEEMKKEERSGRTTLPPTEVQLRYLYLRCLLGERPDAAANFLLDRAVRLRKELTMYGKAVSAVVFAGAGREDAAKLNLQSLKEYTVGTKEMGRYFDTDRAQMSWRAYRIPTQCAAIEAWQHFGQEEEAAALRLWLLQAKRTQMWETSRATADAVYALLTAPQDSTLIGSLAPGGAELSLLKGAKPMETIKVSGGVGSGCTPAGYVKQTYTEAPAVEAAQLRVQKERAGLSWGAVYATFTLPQAEVRTEGKGLQLSRRFEVKRGAAWQPLVGGEELAQGDRVRQVFTLTADRDYDFVSLSVPRPACLEPVRALSGYDWAGGLAAYRAVRDARTQFFIERVSKGTHTLAEELFAVRAGTYRSGTAEVECVFAPEFRGTVSGLSLTVR